MRSRSTFNVALGLFIVACGSDEGSGGPPSSGTGGIMAAPTGGVVGSGGVVSTGGTVASTGGTKAVATGGTVASGGSGATTTTGGTAPTGGTVASGGKAGGPSTGGAGGSQGGASGGAAPKGGSGGASGSSGAGPTGGTSGGSGSGTCQKGTTKGSEVLFIGESFIAASSIPEETTKLARAAGSLSANDSYVDKSVSGTWIGNGASNSIPNQYKNNANGVRFVLMNGGGNDCWQGGQEQHRTAALNAAKTLFGDMDKNGVEKIVYFFYPDPVGGNFSSLKACLDLLRPEMKKLCDAQASPKCYWVDLRETWNGHNEYTSDGIHVAGPGNVPTATAIWKAMEANCVAP